MVASTSSKGQCSSYNVFMNFVANSGDASGILSRGCYENWVETRKAALKQPEESFRRVLTAHVCGLIGRKPFPADIEASLLRCLRKKKVWPCFEDTEVTIGIKGFRKTGFHESRRGIFGANAPSSTLSPRNKPMNSGLCRVPQNITLNPNLLASTNTHSRRSSLCGSAAENASHVSRPRSSLISRTSRDTENTTVNPIEHLEFSHRHDHRRESEHRLGAELDNADAETVNELNEMSTSRKRHLETLDPLDIFNNSAPMISTLNFQPLGIPKRMRQDMTTSNPTLHMDGLAFPGIYNWQNVNSNLILAGFQDVQVASDANKTVSGNQGWQLA